MKTRFFVLVIFAAFSSVLLGANTRVTLQISGAVSGNIVLELYNEQAPITIANFINYVNSGFYDGLIFHRVIKDFMIQGGGFGSNLVQKPTGEPIINESRNGLLNLRGTVAMARTPYPHSATSQFFINHKNNADLDYAPIVYDGSNNAYSKYGYCVFGNVVSGMETVDAIAQLATATENSMANVPVNDVFIQKASINYQITFNSGQNGTISSGNSVQSVQHGQPAAAPTIAPNAGSIFVGWEKNFTSVTSDMVIYAEYITGSGTQNDPYCVSSANALNAIAANPAFWNSSIKLTGDINMEGVEYVGIAGTWDTFFNGTFDGGGKVISNLTIQKSNASLVSLFGNIGEQAMIKDLGLKNVNISVENGYFIAGIASWCKGTIANCYVTGTITGNTQVGGITAGLSNSGKISNCYTQCAVTATNSLAGGIASEAADSSVIEYSYAAALVTSPWKGGIVAKSGPQVQALASFYNTDLNPWSPIGTGKTDAQLKQRQTFINAGWDFSGETANGSDQIWNMPCTGCYPAFDREVVLNADINNDNIVDFEDMAIMASQWLISN